MATLSNYARRMSRLSALIFGEVARTDTSKQSLKVVQLFKEPPLAKRDEVVHWYPEHKLYFAMFQKLRYLGLYRYRLQPPRTSLTPPWTIPEPPRTRVGNLLAKRAMKAKIFKNI